MKNNTINKKEIEKFSKIAEEWWEPNGKFKTLHKFKPIRIKYITDKIKNHLNIKKDKVNYLEAETIHHSLKNKPEHEFLV